MKRDELQHVIRAAAQICDEPVFVIIGSQAVHGSLNEIDEYILIRSVEVDLYPLHAPEKSELLNAIGEMSDFHNTFGYYADAVDDKTAVLPQGWDLRLREISGPLTDSPQGSRAMGLCLELHDLVISKLVAGRDKDIAFFRALVKLGKIERATLRKRLAATTVAPVKRSLVEATIGVAYPDG